MPSFDAGQTGITPGVTILTAAGAVHTARATAGITEAIAGSGVYNFAHPAPGTLLEFIFDARIGGVTYYASVWDDGLTTIPARAGDAMTLTAAYDHAKDDVLTPLAAVDTVVDGIAADYAKTGEAAAAAQAVIEALPVAESIPAGWVTITEATLDDDDEPLGVASVGGSTADALGMRIEAITGGALMNATTVGNTLGTYALPVEPGHTYTLRFALPGAAMAERTVTIA